MKADATERVRRLRGGTAPAHRGGKHHKGGNTTRGNPPANRVAQLDLLDDDRAHVVLNFMRLALVLAALAVLSASS